MANTPITISHSVHSAFITVSELCAKYEIEPISELIRFEVGEHRNVYSIDFNSPYAQCAIVEHAPEAEELQLLIDLRKKLQQIIPLMSENTTNRNHQETLKTSLAYMRNNLIKLSGQALKGDYGNQIKQTLIDTMNTVWGYLSHHGKPVGMVEDTIYFIPKNDNDIQHILQTLKKLNPGLTFLNEKKWKVIRFYDAKYPSYLGISVKNVSSDSSEPIHITVERKGTVPEAEKNEFLKATRHLI